MIVKVDSSFTAPTPFPAFPITNKTGLVCDVYLLELEHALSNCNDDKLAIRNNYGEQEK